MLMASTSEDQCRGRRIHKSNRPWVTYIRTGKQLAEAKAEEREKELQTDRKPLHL
jgi:hypothetical protein